MLLLFCLTSTPSGMRLKPPVSLTEASVVHSNSDAKVTDTDMMMLKKHLDQCDCAEQVTEQVCAILQGGLSNPPAWLWSGRWQPRCHIWQEAATG